MKLAVLRLMSLAVLLAGCEIAPPLPAHEWRGPEAALAEMAERSRQVKTASGTAALTLRRGDGAEVRVDAAFAANPPEALRIRAWKFDRAVADWTFLPDGVWAWQAEGDEAAPPEAQTSGPWSAKHAGLWPLLFGLIEPKPGDEIEEAERGRFTVRRRIDAAVIEVDIDGITQTITQCRIVATTGEILQRVKLQRYRPISGLLFPTRIAADGRSGAFQLDLAEVTLNDELAPAALKPPKRAKPLP